MREFRLKNMNCHPESEPGLAVFFAVPELTRRSRHVSLMQDSGSASDLSLASGAHVGTK